MKKLVLAALALAAFPAAAAERQPSWRDFPGVENSSFVEPSGDHPVVSTSTTGKSRSHSRPGAMSGAAKLPRMFVMITTVGRGTDISRSGARRAGLAAAKRTPIQQL